jgi:hypothetical protein
VLGVLSNLNFPQPSFKDNAVRKSKALKAWFCVDAVALA